MKRDLNSVRVGVRAIDVGYYNTKYTLGRERIASKAAPPRITTKMVPSLAPQHAEALGTAPGTRPGVGRVVRLDSVEYFVGVDAVKRISGSDPRSISHDYSRSISYKVLTYAAMADIAEKAGGFDVVIDTLVVGLPCNTIHTEKPVLESWLRGRHRIQTDGAEVFVTVENLHVVPQPIGALLDYSFEHGNDFDGTALVVDPGGGTLDWYCTTKLEGNWLRSGAYPKSMLACAYAVCDAIDKDLRDNYEVVARVDRAVRGEVETFRANGETYQITSYRRLIDEVVNEALDKMMGSVKTFGDLDLVLVSGGGGLVFADALRTRYPKIANRIKQWSEEPIFANVRGFHAFGEQVSGVS